MTIGTLHSILVIVGVAALAPLVTDQLRRWAAVPPTVLEIAFGILIGPAVLGLATTDTVVDALAAFGLGALFFLAGYEVDFTRILGRPLVHALTSWAGSLLLGLAVGVLLATLLGGGPAAAIAIGLALVTTALGAILPMVRDAGLRETPFGARVMAVGAVGEFGPIVAIVVLFSGERPLHATALFTAFVLVVVATALVARRPAPRWLTRPITATLGTSAQFAVRLSVLAVVAMVWLATELHLDLVLGAFAAGVVMRLLLARIPRASATVIEDKVDGIGFGLLIPFFFVTTGIRFHLPELLADPLAMALLPVGLVSFLLVRAAPVALLFRQEPARSRLALGLYGATALPLVVLITDIGELNGWLAPGTAAGLVGAAMLSVLSFPLLAQRIHGPVTADTGR